MRVISTASEDRVRGLKVRAAVIGVHWGVGVLKNLCSNTARDHITPELYFKKNQLKQTKKWKTYKFGRKFSETLQKVEKQFTHHEV